MHSENQLPKAKLERGPFVTQQVSDALWVELDDPATADLYQIAIGAYAPLKGFLDETDYLAVCSTMHLASGEPWPLPITLAVDEKTASSIQLGENVLLVDKRQTIRGQMTITSIYRPNLLREAEWIYHTTSPSHPGVHYLLNRHPVYLGGPVQVNRLPDSTFDGLLWRPDQVRQAIKDRGWRRIVGFQTRNPIHRAHEYIQKSALETMDGLLIHPLIGPTKDDDIPAPVRIATYREVIRHWYREDRVLLAAYTGAMRYAGPREAVLHALVRHNYGCTHFIVGRDHGGVGHFYDPYDAHRIFQEFSPEELGITPLFFEDAFFCRQCQTMTTAKGCPHSEDAWVRLSGSEVRRRLQNGERIPCEIMRPEVVRILQQYYHSTFQD
ncbi:MAG: sulfate adenylyltransferase [Sulfobacillus benefaciens]|jgi:sulfate adenylyltransferase|uniref:Sulfate adenylyltransferase n=1 Tax=Sulfobacillus benefaciens TaxID=453960 RepID=A0A2T2XA63_9FIRM|nr:MAG: sulfate adenylyltransferase [Sulfobacillus benefaciens]